MSKTIVILVVSLFFFSFLASTGVADYTVVKSISPSPYYDSKPSVWGNNVVWRRANNQNENSYIELREPSWIMVHNLYSGNTYNITQENGIIRDTVYHHAEAPDIWNGKIIYEAQINGNSADTELFMYNISTKDTWCIPIKSTQWAHGHLHAIYGDWITYTHVENRKRQTYLYNYEADISRTVLSKSEPYSTYGFTMSENYVVLTVLNNTNGFEIWIYNIPTTDITKLNYSAEKIIATSINNNEVGLSINETIDNVTQWNTYTYNIQTEEYSMVQPHSYGLLLSDEQTVYENDGKIHINSITLGQTVLTSGQIQYLGDIHGNTVVWMDNTNSMVQRGDARDNFDIYVRDVITTKEIILDSMWIVIPIIILIVVGVLIHKERMRGQG